jgi:hypothetical protein
VLGEIDHDLRAAGAAMMGVMVSPITGADGNVEFLCLVERGGPGVPPSVLDDVVAAAAARGRP